METVKDLLEDYVLGQENVMDYIEGSDKDLTKDGR